MTTASRNGSVPSLYRSAMMTAWVAAAFVVGMCGALLYQRFTASSHDPWKSPQLLELKDRLRAAPRDEQIKDRIRELDLKFRQRYFRRLALSRTGGWLLLGGVIVLVGSLTIAASARRQPPRPRLDPEAGERALRQAASSRRAVAVTGGAVFVGIVSVGFAVRSSLNPRPVAATSATSGTAAAPIALPLPSPEEFGANWPRFRGPDGGGVSATPDAPVTWDLKTGAGFAWQVPVPAPGFNSPIVWGGRVFFAGATAEKREVFCHDTADGRLVWQRAIDHVPGSPAEGPHLSEETGFAAPTMATDGRHAYAIFPNGDLAALTFDGAIAWSKNLGVPHNPYGHATSLAIWEGRLIVQLDQGEGRPQNSRLIAFDGANGRVVWEKPRPTPASWASPIVIKASGKTQIITLGLPFVISYAFADGQELWRAEILDGEITPSPIFAGGRLLIIHPDNKLMALKPDGAGDITDKALEWKAEDNIPDVTSPVSNGELVFTVTSRGIITCFDLQDGKMLWDHDLQTEAHASPVIAGNRLYVTCTNGTTVVAEAGREYKELARNELGEKVFASPAVVKGRIYIRGVQHLFCLAAENRKPATE